MEFHTFVRNIMGYHRIFLEFHQITGNSSGELQIGLPLILPRFNIQRNISNLFSSALSFEFLIYSCLVNSVLVR